MRVLEIRAARYRVGAAVRVRDGRASGCPLLEALAGLQSADRAAGDRMLALFESVAAGGLSNLNRKQFHQVDKAHGIYELIAGRLRVLFFNTESGRIIICTHLFT